MMLNTEHYMIKNMYGETWYESIPKADETQSTMVYIEMWKDTIEVIVFMTVIVKFISSEIIEVTA